MDTGLGTMPQDEVSQHDTFGVARYLLSAVESGEITADDGAKALSEWADPEGKLLESAATKLRTGSQIEDLLRAAARYQHAA